MAVSAAKLEANRRNAQRSTGPRTEEGKRNSKMNALKYGDRAKTLVLPEEDPQELEERRAAWTASMLPRCELEQRAVDEAVMYSWRQDRARRPRRRGPTYGWLMLAPARTRPSRKPFLTWGAGCLKTGSGR